MQGSDVEDRLGSEECAQGVRIGVSDPTRINLGPILSSFDSAPLRSDLSLQQLGGFPIQLEVECSPIRTAVPL